jgi:hypothetical protein
LEKATNEYKYIVWSYLIRHVLLHYELGQAYEKTGRKVDAIDQYETFLNIWKNADEELGSVKDAKRRLSSLKESI